MSKLPASKSGRNVSLFLCQCTLREKNDLLTAVRLVEGFTTSMIGQLTTGEAMYFPVSASAVIIFRSEQPCEARLTIKVRDPDGQELQGTSNFLVRSKSLIEGHTLNVAFKLPGDREGDYWFEVYLDDELVTKAPLRITQQRLSPGSLELRRGSGSTDDSPASSGSLH